MFQYTHELVINSLNEAISKLNDSGSVTIERGGEYLPKFVQGGVIWKTTAVPGKLDKMTLDVAQLALEANKRYALNLFVKLVDPHALFEYGYPNYQTFGKQVLVDFRSVDPTTDAQTILDSILPQNMENDLTFVKGSVDGSKVTLEVGHFGLRFDSLALAEYDPTTCDSCIGEYMAPKALLDRGDWDNKDASLTRDETGQDPFGTGQWLIENLRFPSYPNIRYAAVGSDNYPIAGADYTMFSFAYESPRPGLGGVSGVGQYMVAVTRHIYYVHSSVADKFETLLGNLGRVELTKNDGKISTELSEDNVPSGDMEDDNYHRTEKAPVEKENKA